MLPALTLGAWLARMRKGCARTKFRNARATAYRRANQRGPSLRSPRNVQPWFNIVLDRYPTTTGLGTDLLYTDTSKTP